ncbi:MAG: LamG-like jellyroll fold domain-containing protein, partial [Bryobacteraceae bacterium]
MLLKNVFAAAWNVALPTAFIKATLEGSSLLLYINGQPVQGASYPFPRINSATPLTIGAGVIANNSASAPFAGIMDELSLYKSAL